MTIDKQHSEATQGEQVRVEYHTLAVAEAAQDRLGAAGFNADQITLTTPGGRTEPDSTFVPGGIEVSVLADEAEKALRAKG